MPLLALPAVACGRAAMPLALDARGERALRIAQLGWLMIVLASVIFVVVAGALLVALYRPRPAPGSDGPLVPALPADPDVLGALVDAGPRAAWHELRGSSLFWIVTGGIALPGVVMAGLAVLTFLTLPSLYAARNADLEIQVIGHQFWWEVRYDPQASGPAVVTANEIHVPVGRQIRIMLDAQDVIHSFWVPQLQGKIDLIPGKANELWLDAGRPGVYRGQCAEYCGLQHARMALYVVAEPSAQFEAWLAAEQSPAAQAAAPDVLRGAQVFAREGCIACHTVRYGAGGSGPANAGGTGLGTGGVDGPDLTHLGSRRSLASAWLDNTPENLSHWISDAQQIKPGSNMPSFSMDPDSLRSLVAYLESLH